MPSDWPLLATCATLAFTGIAAVGLILRRERWVVRLRVPIAEARQVVVATTNEKPEESNILTAVLALQHKGHDAPQIAAALGIPIADAKLVVLVNRLTL